MTVAERTPEQQVVKLEKEVTHYRIRNIQLKQDLTSALLEPDEYKTLSAQQKQSLDSLSAELGKVKRKLARKENSK